MAMRLTDEQLDWLCARLPEPQALPRGGRPPMHRPKAMGAIFRVLDNGAKCKDLPRHFGSKSAVHEYLQRWTRQGVFEYIMRDAGQLVEERGGKEVVVKTDDRGRTIDIYALRHTFGTHLSKAGVPLRTAQAAMRHSDPSLTANVYTDPKLLDVAGAVASLPDLPLGAVCPTATAVVNSSC